MNIPSLPTDNLYKLLALSGVFLCIACLTLSSIEFQNYSNKRAEYLNKLVDVQKEIDSIVVTKENAVEANKQIKSVNEIIEKQNNDIKALIEPYNQNRLLYGIGFWSGLVVSLSGFLLWYVKVQRYEDKLLKESSSK